MILIPDGSSLSAASEPPPTDSQASSENASVMRRSVRAHVLDRSPPRPPARRLRIQLLHHWQKVTTLPVG